MNTRNRLSLASLVALLFCAVAHAQATAPTEITETAGNLTAGFTTIKTLIMLVVTFGLVVGYVKLLRRK
jgi:hypothetical protein